MWNPNAAINIPPQNAMGGFKCKLIDISHSEKQNCLFKSLIK
jgi:hypothetical protein